MLRRPTTPTDLDLFLVGWALPIVFFTGFVSVLYWYGLL